MNVVGVVQRLERQVVALEIVGSNPIAHPTFLFQSGVGPLTRAMGRSQAVKARGFDSRIRRFESYRPSQRDPVAQLAEHLTFNQRVRSSSLRWVTSLFLRGRGGMADAPDLGSGVPGTYEFESLRPHQTIGRDRPGRPIHPKAIRGFAGVTQWQSASLPSWIRGFDSHHPLQFLWKVLASNVELWYNLLR
jgi:hypothetical protein